MSDKTIESEVLIEAPMEVVWRTITEPDQIQRWFADRVELDTTPGSTGRFVFNNPEGVHVAALVVHDVQPPNRFSFRWGHPDGEAPTEANSLLVEFVLDRVAHERTRLRVTESGLERVTWNEHDKTNYAEEHREGWSNFLDKLRALLGATAGRGVAG
jgi:uncharacterized protein YndB with AHSA1/START domain